MVFDIGSASCIGEFNYCFCRGEDIMPKVSIVLPTYNGERWLKESLESIINQTYVDWELIIVDDCSDDNTLDIAKHYQNEYENIKVIHNNVNKKLPASLNAGFRAAIGEYLTWTSDDNMYEPTAIEEMVRYLDENSDKMMVCTAMKDVDENGNLVAERREYSDELMYYNDFVGACFMYRRTVLDEVGEYDENLFCVEDYEYWFRILVKYESIGHIDEILYIDRLHGKSLSTTKRDYVQLQLAKMRKKYLDVILYRLSGRPDLLTSMYFEIMATGEEVDSVRDKFCEKVPEINMVVNDIKKHTRPCIIYGAGDWGGKAHVLLGKETAYFADTSPMKVGNRKEGLEILSVEDMVSKIDKFDIVVAVSYRSVYELLYKLRENEVKKCYVYIDGWSVSQ